VAGCPNKPNISRDAVSHR
jgi:hypothetical protein